ncbi:MAG: hypothetical protein AAF333_17800 [Planctomycetota bacterium]
MNRADHIGQSDPALILLSWALAHGRRASRRAPEPGVLTLAMGGAALALVRRGRQG